MALATWDELRPRGSINFTKQDKAGGKRCPWAQRAMAWRGRRRLCLLLRPYKMFSIWGEGSNEHPRSAGRQLELAQHRRVVVSCWFSCAAGPDNKLKPPPYASESGD